MKSLKFLVAILGLHFCLNVATIQNVQINEHAMQVIESKIQIFGYAQCPYFAKVAYFIQSQNLLDVVEFIDASLPEHATRLKAVSGKTQVPYLVDAVAGVNMAESDDIIMYLMKKYNITYAKPVSIIKNIENNQAQTQKSYNPKTFLSDIKQYTKPVIILVSTTWCPPCQIFKPIFLQVAEQYADQCEFICVDGDANYEILMQLGVRSYPTVICYKDHKKINVENYRSYEGLIELIEKIIKK